MIGRSRRHAAALACAAVLGTAGCSFGGLNSLPLPGAVGRGNDAKLYHVELANVGTLESNSPVMISDVVVGSISKMTVRDFHADVEISVQPGTVIPANAVATVGQTSLLGSMHLALAPPPGQAATGQLPAGATIGIDQSSTYPSTEQTLSSLAVVVNGGGLGQIGEIVKEFNAALNGREDQIRDLLTRLNDFVGMLADQTDDINASINAVNRMASGFAGQHDVITRALNRIPPALEVLNKERPRITTALEKFRVFSDTATGLVNDSGADLVRNLQNLEPTVKALADIGPNLPTVLAYAPTFPYPQNFIDRGIRGDYMNQFITFDFTVPRLKRGLFLGTRWGQEGATLVPAPGDPMWSTYTKDPLNAPITAPQQVQTVPKLIDPPAPSAAPADASGASADSGAPGTEVPAVGPLPGPASAPGEAATAPTVGGN